MLLAAANGISPCTGSQLRRVSTRFGGWCTQPLVNTQRNWCHEIMARAKSAVCPVFSVKRSQHFVMPFKCQRTPAGLVLAFPILTSEQTFVTTIRVTFLEILAY